MLTRLSIRNVVLIEALDLDFQRGLGVLTGETGAGKSILLDALGPGAGQPSRQWSSARWRGQGQRHCDL
jgi:DNA repair ATPase RecN